ncbi:MAG: EamA family transporter [Candidatus Nanoarchaeia archaeon]
MKAYVIAMFFSLLLSVLGQLLLKRGMNVIGKVSLLNRKVLSTVFRMLTNTYIIVGGIVFVASLALWLVVLSKLDVSYAYPIVSINYVAIALASKLFFKETVSKLRWVSIFIICFGVVLVSLS